MLVLVMINTSPLPSPSSVKYCMISDPNPGLYNYWDNLKLLKWSALKSWQAGYPTFVSWPAIINMITITFLKLSSDHKVRRKVEIWSPVQQGRKTSNCVVVVSWIKQKSFDILYFVITNLIFSIVILYLIKIWGEKSKVSSDISILQYYISALILDIIVGRKLLRTMIIITCGGWLGLFL